MKALGHIKNIDEFDLILESLKDIEIQGFDRSLVESLAYQMGWTNLLLK